MTPTDAQIKAYWDGKAEKLGTDPSATMKDVFLRSLEIEAISNRLLAEDNLLDIGCGNAFGSLIFAEHAKSVVAADFSEKMVAMAQEAIRVSGRANIRAVQGDITSIGSEHPGEFSAASCVRCLINLPREEQQYAAIGQLAQVLAPGGRLFLIEGVEEHFRAMNDARVRVGLPAIPLDWHNRLFAKEKFEKALSSYFTLEAPVDFGEYYFLSRVVHPLLVEPEELRFQSKPNQVARTIWQSGVVKSVFSHLSTLMLYVCRKP